jgi:hypothetical protein
MLKTKQIIGGRSPGRNWLCPCGSGIKFKECHGSIQGIRILRELNVKILYDRAKQQNRK